MFDHKQGIGTRLNPSLGPALTQTDPAVGKVGEEVWKMQLKNPGVGDLVRPGSSSPVLSPEQARINTNGIRATTLVWGGGGEGKDDSSQDTRLVPITL